jgi:hypothetical protein
MEYDYCVSTRSYFQSSESQFKNNLPWFVLCFPHEEANYVANAGSREKGSVSDNLQIDIH